ncbi:MAG: sensor histidine kinase [Phycisphaerales bacterium]
MKQRKRAFGLFAVCVAAVFGAMTWLTSQLLRYEQKEHNLRYVENLGNQRRVALWRMESSLGILLTQEAARPYFHYFTFYEPDQAYIQLLTQACAGDVSVPSPLLTGEPDFCRLHFQLKAGVLSTPRAPADTAQRGEAMRRSIISPSDYDAAQTDLHRLELLLPVNQLPAMALRAARAHGLSDDGGAPDPRSLAGAPLSRIPVQTVDLGAKQPRTSEWYARQQTANTALRSAQTSNMAQTDSTNTGDIAQGMLAPYWVATANKDPELFLLRTVRIRGEEITQGVWMDWPRLRATLLASVDDLLPSAELKPDLTPSPNPERTLAGIRATLQTPDVPPTPLRGITPLRKSLLIAWSAVLVALLAIGIVLHASMELGERRGRFVSAVTHELRTPLTTFCLYSEMLADGMVRDEQARSEYLGTLKRESKRLAKIVENVLCYARLSEVRATSRAEVLDAGELLCRIMPTLERRAVESGMDLTTKIDPAHGVRLNADPQTIERILANLVENACRYAADHTFPDGTSDPRIHIEAAAHPGELRIVVADHGPGVPRHLRGRLFKAFNRAGRETNNAAPGLGLGLSLSRGLARSLGGDLVLLDDYAAAPGAAFELRIPAEVRVGRPEPVAATA